MSDKPTMAEHVLRIRRGAAIFECMATEDGGAIAISPEELILISATMAAVADVIEAIYNKETDDERPNKLHS